MFQRKVVRRRGRHVALLSVPFCDDLETFRKDDTQILQWISLFLLAHAPITDIRMFSEHCKLVFSASFANFQIRQIDTGNYLKRLIVLKTLGNCDSVFR